MLKIMAVRPLSCLARADLQTSSDEVIGSVAKENGYDQQILQPALGPAGDPEDVEFVERPDGPYRHDKREDRWTKLEPHASGAVYDYHANEVRHVFSREDIDRRLPAPEPDQAPGPDEWPYLRAAVEEFGREEFIRSGGVIGTLSFCGHHVGQTNLFRMLLEEADLVDALCERITACNLAEIRVQRFIELARVAGRRQ
ncbi:MAG: uroporphyrinogen decarboxylase family protein [Planctomycetota bacterium]|nr:uroporphyrinogen decarboxylase family protein [Planctomycetota bacterium]